MRPFGRAGRPAAASGERLCAERQASGDFRDCVRAGRYVVFELDAGREGVALTLHQLEDLSERRVASAPGQVFGAVRGCRAIFQVDAGDATVELSQERNRALTGASHVM